MAVSIGTSIRALRLQAGMTQDDLAEKLHVTRQAISNYERGKTNPDVGLLTQMADVFHVDLEELIYGNDRLLVRRRRLIFAIAVLILLVICLSVSVPLASRIGKEAIGRAEVSWFRIFTLGILVPLFITGIAWCVTDIVLLLGTVRFRLPGAWKIICRILWILFAIFLLLVLHEVLMIALETGFGPQWLYVLSMDAFLLSTRHAVFLYPFLILIGILSGAVQYSE